MNNFTINVELSYELKIREAVKVEKKVWKNLGGGSKKWKNLFVFLDELGLSEYLKKSMENGSDPP